MPSKNYRLFLSFLRHSTLEEVSAWLDGHKDEMWIYETDSEG